MSDVKLPQIHKPSNGGFTRNALREEDSDEEDVVSVSDEEESEYHSDNDDEYELANLLQKNKKEEEEEQITLKRTSPRPALNKNPEIIDDFFANFLKAKAMQKTLDIFQEELYEKKQLNNNDFDMVVPDVYQHNQLLEEQVKMLKHRVEKEKEISTKALTTFQKVKDEKEYHKRNHLRIVQEAKILRKNLERAKRHAESYDPVINELRSRYEKAMKEKTLIKYEVDKLQARLQALESTPTDDTKKESTKPLKNTRQANGTGRNSLRKTDKPEPVDTSKYSVLPPDNRPNPYRTRSIPVFQVDSLNPQETFEGHTMCISSMAINPKAPVVATVSDDMTWKMWNLSNGKIFMSGEGHNDWICGVDFHPRGTHLCTSSGDGTAKLWDLTTTKCMLTLQDHTLAVWSCMFNETGDFIVTASMDHTGRLWDIGADKCRTTFRAHKDSVNHAMFIPFTNNVITCSADKTVQLWDIRLDANGNSTQTLYGHDNALNYVTVNLQGDTIASSDCDGCVFLWDMRNLEKELCKIDAGPHPAQKMSFDPSGRILAVASDDQTVKLFTVGANAKLVNELRGHKDGVHDVKFDSEGKYLISCSSDSTFIVYQ